MLTLINGRKSLSYSEVTTTLVTLELRRKDKECSSSDTSTEVLTASESSPNQRRENQHSSNWKPMVGNHKLRKSRCAFYKRKNTGRVIVLQGSIS